jgi:Tol biopolymer transport system component
VSLYDEFGRRAGNELVVGSVDGGSISRVPVGPFIGPPAWSPDGTSLLVARIVGSEPTDGTRPETDLFVIGLDGEVAERLTYGGASDPDWAADGTIAFTRGGQIQLMRRGEGWRQLTWRGGSAPSWAPNAKRLAFVRDGQVWSVQADGRAPRRLTRRGGNSPAWSPDGRRIAFVRPGAEIDGLWTMRADGNAPRFTGQQGGPYGYSAIRDPAWQALAAR